MEEIKDSKLEELSNMILEIETEINRIKLCSESDLIKVKFGSSHTIETTKDKAI